MRTYKEEGRYKILPKRTAKNIDSEELSRYKALKQISKDQPHKRFRVSDLQPVEGCDALADITG